MRRIFKRAIEYYLEDKGPRMGAALAFYSLLSISPSLILIVSVLTPLSGQRQARLEVLSFAHQYLGETGTLFIRELLLKAQQVSFGWQAFLGILTLLMAASLVFYELQNIVNEIWCVNVTRKKWRRTIYRKLRAFFIVLSMAPILMLLFFTRTAISFLPEVLGRALPQGFPLLAVLDWLVAMLTTFGMFCLLFKFLPERKLRTEQLWPGALFAAFFFVSGRYFISLYLARASSISMYGVASSLVFFLFWVYYSGQIFLFGVELSKAYAVLKKHLKLDKS